MTITLRPTASVTVPGHPALQITGGSVTLDALAIPYGTADIEIPRADDLDIEDFNPNVDTRIIVTGGDAAAGTSRVFDLGLRSRSVVDDGTRVLLALATDEAILQDYASLTVDTGALAHQSSLRGVVNYALGKIGATLNADPPNDADMRAYFDARNMFKDPRFIGTPGGGYSAVNASMEADAVWPNGYYGQAINGVWVNTPTGVDSYLQLSDTPGGLPYGITAGKSYTFSATGSVRQLAGGAEDASRSRALNVFVRDSAGAFQLYASAKIPNVQEGGAFDSGNEHRVSVTFPVPAGATEVQIRAYLGHSSGSISWTAFRLDEVHPIQDDTAFFTGETEDTGAYSYSWSGAANASASERTALVDRPPEMLVWNPGVTGWDFLEPLTTQAGFRLFCDEQRVWRLIDPATYSTGGGLISLSGWNVTDGADTISREDSEVFATGVVVRYAWMDGDAVAQTKYDVAGTPEKVFVLDVPRPYPGPGVAQAILLRRQGTGRTQDVTALVDWTLTPGQEAVITLLDPEQQGKVISVRFSLGDDGLMDVGTRTLIDVHDGTIDALDGTIDALVGVIDAL